MIRLWSLVQVFPRLKSLLCCDSLYDLSEAVRSALSLLPPKASLKKINWRSSSRLRLMLELVSLIRLIYPTSFSTNKDKAISLLTANESLVGTRTGLSTSFSTITSFSTWMNLGYWMSLSSSTKKVSMISIWILRAGVWTLSFLNSTKRVSKWILRVA